MNPLAHIKKIPLVFSNVNDKGELLDPNDNLDYNEVYDDPSEQTVTFDVNSDKAVINDVGYDNGNGLREAPERTAKNVNSAGFEIEQGITEERADGSLVANTQLASKFDPKATLSRYKYPTLDLLKKYDTDGKSFIDMEEQQANKNRIVQVLGNFGVIVDSIKATVGPTITLYEITLQPGIKISKVLVPMGVIAIIYESRPNVTSDAAALAGG